MARCPAREHNYVVVFRRTPLSKPQLTQFTQCTVPRILETLQMIESDDFEVEIISITMTD